MKSDITLSKLPQSIDSNVSADESENVLDFGMILQTLKRKWLLIVGVTVLTTVASVVKALTEAPVYNSRFEILVQSQSIETEVISNVPDTLTTQERVSINNDLLKILLSPNVLEPVIEKIKASYPQGCPSSNQSDNISNEIAYDPCYKVLSRSIYVGASGRNSNILQVSFGDLDELKVQILVDLLAKAYLDYSLESKQADIRLGLDFVEQKIPDLRQKVESLQDQMQSLRLKYDLVDPGSRGNQLTSQLGTFSSQKLNLEIEIKQLRDIYEDLNQQIVEPTETSSSSALSENPRYQTVLNTLLALDTQLAEANTLYLDSSPDMQILKDQRQNLLSLLARQGQQSQREILSQIRELEVRDQSVSQTIDGLNTDIEELSGISREFMDIERELGIAIENLNRFLSKREALEIDAAQSEIPWEIITPPTEPLPQPVNLLQYLLVGTTLGIILGTGAALLLDKSSDIIHVEKDIQRYTRLPILGRIPLNRLNKLVDVDEVDVSETPIGVGATVQAGQNGMGKISSIDRKENYSFTKSYESDPFFESFRSLYTNIRLVNSAKPIRSLAISSAMESEGKSTVAVHLAEAAASMGQKVLLVEADLRQSQIHNYLELPNVKGLTDLFSGEANPAVIQKVSPDSNLYVITSGSKSLEPMRLFSSRSMKRFTEQVKEKFDFIIYDAPPLLGQSDACLIADNTDGLLLVTQPGKIKQKLLDRAMEQLRIADINILGIVTRESV